MAIIPASLTGSSLASKRLTVLLITDLILVIAVLVVHFLTPHRQQDTAIALWVIGLSTLPVSLAVLFDIARSRGNAGAENGTAAGGISVLEGKLAAYHRDLKAFADYVDKCQKHDAARFAELAKAAADNGAVLTHLNDNAGVAAQNAANAAVSANAALEAVRSLATAFSMARGSAGSGVAGVPAAGTNEAAAGDAGALATATAEMARALEDAAESLASLMTLAGDDGEVALLRERVEKLQESVDANFETVRKEIDERVTPLAGAVRALENAVHENGAVPASVERDGTLPASLMAKAMAAGQKPASGGAVGRIIGKAAATQRRQTLPHVTGNPNLHPAEDELWDTVSGMEDTGDEDENDDNGDDDDGGKKPEPPKPAPAPAPAPAPKPPAVPPAPVAPAPAPVPVSPPHKPDEKMLSKNTPVIDGEFDEVPEPLPAVPAKPAPPPAAKPPPPAPAAEFVPQPAVPPPPVVKSPPPPRPLEPQIAEAWAAVTTEGHASAALIQRHLAVTYGRAAEILETLEKLGYVGPDAGPGNPRAVLKKAAVAPKPIISQQTTLLASLGLPEEPAVEKKPRATGTRRAPTLVVVYLAGPDAKPYLRGTGPGLREDAGVALEPAGLGLWNWYSPDPSQAARVTIWKNDTQADTKGQVEIAPNANVQVEPVFAE